MNHSLARVNEPAEIVVPNLMVYRTGKTLDSKEDAPVDTSWVTSFEAKLIVRPPSPQSQLKRLT